jgi:surface antigen
MVRKNEVRRLAVALCMAVALAACESPPSQQAMGTAIGAVAGGLIGSQIGSGSGRTVAIVGGALVGGMLGNVIGKQMDDADRRKMGQALEQNANGQSTQWKNDNTGATYKVTPKGTFVRDGRECRTFEQEALVDGQPRKMTGTACKRADGDSWEVTA